jgi:hypothetical protein
VRNRRPTCARPVPINLGAYLAIRVASHCLCSRLFNFEAYHLLSAAAVATDTVAYRQLLRLKRISHGITTRDHQMGNQAGFTVGLVLLPQKRTDAIGQGHNFQIQLMLRVSFLVSRFGWLPGILDPPETRLTIY